MTLVTDHVTLVVDHVTLTLVVVDHVTISGRSCDFSLLGC